MYLQVLVADQVADGERLRRQWERWAAGVAPATAGWMGATGGVTPDGGAVLVNLSDAATGHAEDAWSSVTEDCLAGPATVLETADVTVQAPGDHRDAGFVQVMVGAVASRSAFEQVEDEIGPAFMAFRPDFLTGYRAWFPDGTLAAVDYFRSEAEARAGEGRPMPADLHAGFGRWLSLVDGAAWYSLPDPWQANRPS